MEIGLLWDENAFLNKNKPNEIHKTAFESNKLRYIFYKQKQEAINSMNKDALYLCKYPYKNI